MDHIPNTAWSKLVTMIRIHLILVLFYAEYLSVKAIPLVGKDVRIAENHEFPFIVSLSYNKTKYLGKEEKIHACGGALITRKHVLTAAHCVEDEDNYNKLVVKVGSIDLRNAKVYEIQWWVTYDEWKENQVYEDEDVFPNDIAIVKLYESVSSLDFTQLPTLTNIPEIHLYRKRAVTAGWGSIENGKRPRYLRTAELFVLPYNESFYYHPDLDRTPNPNQYLLTKIQPFALIQCGDSGGPLLINRKEIIGVNVAHCYQKGDLERQKHQNSHTSVLYYIHFITDVIRKRN